MKVGDLVRVKNIHLHWRDGSKTLPKKVPGFLMQVLAINGSQRFVMILEGKHLGLKHWINGKGLEVISEGR